MNSTLSGLLMMGMTMMEDMKTQSEERKEEILAKWELTKDAT